MTLKDGAVELRLVNPQSEEPRRGAKKPTSDERKRKQAEWAKKNREKKRKEAGKPARGQGRPKGAKALEKAIRSAVEEGTLVAEDAERQRKAYHRVQALKGKLSKLTSDCRERLKAQEAAFEAVMTQAIDKSDHDMCVRQIVRQQVGYQELGEVRAQNSEERSIAKEAVKKAQKRLDELMENPNQMELPGVSE